MNREKEGIYTREQAAELLDASLTTLRNWAIDGTLLPRYLGRRVYYFKKDILKAMRTRQPR